MLHLLTWRLQVEARFQQRPLQRTDGASLWSLLTVAVDGAATAELIDDAKTMCVENDITTAWF